jgi:hypothetical protein
MRYTFRHAETDELREIERPMTDPPAERFTDEDGEWVRVWEAPAMKVVGRSLPGKGNKRTRRGEEGAVQHRGQELPVSQSLPRDTRPGRIVHRYGHTVREHDGGKSYTTLEGDRIIDGHDAARRACDETGRTREE